MVRFKDVSFGYEKDAKILNNISFCIETGTIFGIFGPSGSGKTTLAKLICGLLKPSEGSIEVSEKPLMVLQFPERQLFGKTVSVSERIYVGKIKYPFLRCKILLHFPGADL